MTEADILVIKQTAVNRGMSFEKALTDWAVKKAFANVPRANSAPSAVTSSYARMLPVMGDTNPANQERADNSAGPYTIPNIIPADEYRRVPIKSEGPQPLPQNLVLPSQPEIAIKKEP
jgi:hypothetical protein